MKTLLMWGIGSDFSRRVAQALAANGHRLLLVGLDQGVLEELDTTLAQSELHRLTATIRLSELAAWTREQNVGLDGLVLFAPVPEMSASLFVPRSINLRNGERCVFDPLELLRELLPELRRGKKPKRVLVVLDWFDQVSPNPLGAVLAHTWHAATSSITQELNREGSHFTVLELNKSTYCPPTAVQASSRADAPSLSEPLDSEASDAPSSVDTVPLATEYVQSALALIGMCFSPATQFFNGQFLQHPNPDVGLGATPAIRL